MRARQQLAALVGDSPFSRKLGATGPGSERSDRQLVTACQQSSLAGSSAITRDGGTSTVYGNGFSASYGPNRSFIYNPDGGCMVDGVSCPN
jgi:hypothetical protein